MSNVNQPYHKWKDFDNLKNHILCIKDMLLQPPDRFKTQLALWLRTCMRFIGRFGHSDRVMKCVKYECTKCRLCMYVSLFLGTLTNKQKNR